MTEPSFGQIPSVPGGCPTDGWRLDFPDDKTVVLSTTYWPDWQPTRVKYRADGGEWAVGELVRGEVTSDEPHCRSTRVTLTVRARRRLVLRTFDEQGRVAATEWYRHLEARRSRYI